MRRRPRRATWNFTSARFNNRRSRRPPTSSAKGAGLSPLATLGEFYAALTTGLDLPCTKRKVSVAHPRPAPAACKGPTCSYKAPPVPIVGHGDLPDRVLGVDDVQRAGATVHIHRGRQHRNELGAVHGHYFESSSGYGVTGLRNGDRRVRDSDNLHRWLRRRRCRRNLCLDRQRRPNARRAVSSQQQLVVQHHAAAFAGAGQRPGTRSRQRTRFPSTSPADPTARCGLPRRIRTPSAE